MSGSFSFRDHHTVFGNRLSTILFRGKRRFGCPPEITINAATEALCIRIRDELLAFLSARGYKTEVFSRLRNKEFTGSHIVIPAYVTFIGEEAFRRRHSLESVVIPDSVTGIGQEAFSGCTGLKSIVIPDSVRTFGADVFRGCSPDLVIRGKKGSKAERFAAKNGITFEAME